MKTLDVFFAVLVVELLFSTFSCDMFVVPVGKVEEDNIEIIVSDGITNNDMGSDGPEILPNATVYHVEMENAQSQIKYGFSAKVKGVAVSFYVRERGGVWFPLGEDSFSADEAGIARLDGLRAYIPHDILNKAPIDLDLKAEIVFEDGTSASDEKGLVRVLSKQRADNPEVLLADHDNTIHATGGLNAPQDYLDVFNYLKIQWPYVDQHVEGAIAQLIDSGVDVIVVTGMLNVLRDKAREQMNLHFENGGVRLIPIVDFVDVPVNTGFEYKADALGILKALYGADNILAMVGDTVRQDGYGAHANNILYIPFQVNYAFWPQLLDSWGFGTIDPHDIAWNWKDVMVTLGYDQNNAFARMLNTILQGGVP